MDIYHTIVRPLVTEKSTHQVNARSDARGGAYAFEVVIHANKAEIRDAVEKIYGVKVETVRTSIKRVRPRRFRFRFGKSHLVKKAVVVLAPNSHIDLF